MKSRFDWRGTYFNLVSFVAIVVLLVAVIIAGNNILRLAMPQMSLSQHEWRQVESFEEFKRFHRREPTRVRPKGPPGAVDTTSAATAEEESEAELRAEWQEQRTLLIEGQKRRGIWSLLQAIVTIIVVFPVFWWHRRKAKELRVNGLTDEG